MPTISISQQIEAPPEQVWSFISDLRRGPEYVTVMKELLYVSDEPIKQGTVYRELSKIGPGMSETEWVITTLEAHCLQVHRCREPTLQATLMVRIEPNGRGSKLLHQTEFQVMPVFRPLGWLLEKLFVHRLMTAEMRETVQNLKRIIESTNKRIGEDTHLTHER